MSSLNPSALKKVESEQDNCLVLASDSLSGSNPAGGHGQISPRAASDPELAIEVANNLVAPLLVEANRYAAADDLYPANNRTSLIQGEGPLSSAPHLQDGIFTDLSQGASLFYLDIRGAEEQPSDIIPFSQPVNMTNLDERLSATNRRRRIS